MLRIKVLQSNSERITLQGNLSQLGGSPPVTALYLVTAAQVICKKLLSTYAPGINNQMALFEPNGSGGIVPTSKLLYH